MPKCKYCPAEFGSQGALNLHEYHKHKHQENKEEKNESKKDECSHDFRLLSVHVRQENKAIQAGYEEVCKRCLTLKA